MKEICLRCYMTKMNKPSVFCNQGVVLETDPGLIAMVIRVQLYIHKPYETNANWHCKVTHGWLRLSGRACVWIVRLLLPWQLDLVLFRETTPSPPLHHIWALLFEKFCRESNIIKHKLVFSQSEIQNAAFWNYVWCLYLISNTMFYTMGPYYITHIMWK